MTVPMVDTSQMIQQQVLHQQMIQMQQRAFLASSLQQNLEIQKQLLQQNQQLQSLLVQTSINSQSPISRVQSSEGLTPTPPNLSYPISPVPLLQVQALPLMSSPIDRTTLSLSMQNLSVNTSIDSAVDSFVPSRSANNIPIPPPPPPPPPPPLSPSATDVFGRAKTVRIGKWRWPPPAEGAAIPANNFFEFKRKKQMEKSDKFCEEGNPLMDLSETPDLIETNFNSKAETKKIKEQNDINDRADKSEKNEVKVKKEEKIKVIKNVVPSSIGKLRISSEMKAKLEQLTIDQSVRSRKDGRERAAMQSRSMDDIASVGAVKKLSEQRKALLEQQLMGSLRSPSELIEQKSGSNRRLGHRNEGTDALHSKYAQSVPVLNNYISSQTESHLSKSGSHKEKSAKQGSREIRERRDELGPFSRRPSHMPTITSTIQGECGDRLSYSTEAERIFFDEMSTTNSMAYEESIASSAANLQRSSHKFSHELQSSKCVKRMSVPPPPPPINGLLNVSVNTNGVVAQPNHNGPSSVAASSSYYAPNSPIMARPNRKLPPPPITSVVSQDRLSFDRIEFEESNEFLNPVEAPPPSVVNRPEQNTVDKIKTKLHHTNDAPFYTYSKVKWKLNLRKEVRLEG